MGDFPWMTERGTFIINGTERVVVTQLVRSPGAYLMDPKDAEKQLFVANLMPARGSWLELEIDKKGRVYVRIDRKRKLPVTVLLRAMGMTDEEILRRFEDSLYIKNTIEADTEQTRSEEGALIELFRKQRPGEPPSRRQRAQPAQPALLRPEALRPDARRPLQAQQAARPRRRPRDAHADRGRHRHARPQARRPAEDPRHVRGGRRHQGLRRRGDGDAARGRGRPPRRVRALRQPPPAHRRRADPGGLPDRPLPHGARRPRAPHHRGRGHDHAADDHQHPPGRGRAEGVLRLLAAQPVHGPDELALRPDAPAAPQRPRRRRPHARARADRGPRRAPDPLRPHVPDRDAGGPEHRPDRLALELRAGVRVRLRHDARTASSRRARSPTRSSTSTRPRSRSAGSARPTSRSTRTASSRTTRSSAVRRPATTSTTRPRTST